MKILTIIGFYLIIAFLWKVAEFALYGKSSPRIVDDIVAIVLAISLYYNFN
jgi:hypothetical protein